MTEKPLQGRTILVTGGAGILGTAFARRLSEDGAQVALADSRPALARKVAGEVTRETRGTVRGYAVRLPDAASVKALARAVESDLGPVDVLVNNAAFKSPGFFRRFEDFRRSDWDSVMAVNVTGTMVCSQVFGSRMAKRGEGRIINIASVYGVLAPDNRIYSGSRYMGRPISSPAVYSASKAAVIGLTRYLAAYWGPRGVLVNAVSPGGVHSGQNSEFRRRYSTRVPVGRMAERGEIAEAVAFLCRAGASYINGQNLLVDGGLSAW